MYPNPNKKIGLPTRRWLTASGDGLGTFNLIGDYSATPTDFYFETTYKFDIYSLIITISDNAKFNQIDYGAIPGGLTNGVGFFAKQVGIPEFRLLNTVNIKQNYEYLSFIEETRLTQFDGTPQTMQFVLDVENVFGIPFTLNAGDRFIVRLNDNFTTLVSHTFGIKGIDSRVK
jgi:hypothetical protein